MKVIRSNLLEKVLALLFAIFMWASARTQQRPIPGGWEARLVQRGKPEDLAVVKGPTKVRFSVVANRQEHRRLENSAIAIVDLSSAKPGEHDFDIYYQLSSSISVERIEVRPSRARFVFEKIVPKEFPIEVEWTGTLPAGFGISEPTATPTRVFVKGRTGLISRVERAVARVDVSDAAASLQTAEVHLVDESGEQVLGLHPSPSKVDVTLRYEEQEETVELPILNHLTALAAPGGKVEGVTLDPDSISVTGRVDRIKAVRWIDTETVTVPDVRETTKRQVALQIPSGLSAAIRTTTATIVVKSPPPETDEVETPEDGAGKEKGKAKADAKSAGTSAKPDAEDPTEEAGPAGAEATPAGDGE